MSHTLAQHNIVTAAALGGLGGLAAVGFGNLSCFFFLPLPLPLPLPSLVALTRECLAPRGGEGFCETARGGCETGRTERALGGTRMGWDGLG